MSDWFLTFNLQQAPAPDAPSGTGLDAAARTAAEKDWSHRLRVAAGDDAALLGLLRGESPPEVKLAAIASLTSEAALKAAEREFRDHDRRIHRLAKQRHALAVAQREARTRAAAVIEDARALARESQIPLNLLVDIDRSWQALDASLLDAGQVAEYAALTAQMATVTRERAELPLKIRHWTAQANDALALLKTVCADAARGSQGRDRLAAVSAQARSAIAAAPPEAVAANVLDELTRTVALCPQLDERLRVLEGKARDLIRQWTQLAPLADASLEAALQARFAQFQHEREQASEHRRAEQRERGLERQRVLREQQAQALNAQLDLAEAALAGGQLGPTHGHMVEIDRLLGGHAAEGEQRRRIDMLQSRYAQLKGWQHWAGGRARDELVQQAEALAAATGGSPAEARELRLSIKQRADLVDDMRARWKDLDRLGGATSRSLWQRFDAALKTAHEPVARTLAAQRLARTENLLARERLLAELEAVPLNSVGENLTAADMRSLAGGLERFQAAWRKLGPIEHTVPQRAREPLVERMNSALQRVEAPLHEARRLARHQREGLVARAQALAKAVDTGARDRDLVGKVRELQTQWQEHARAMPLARADETALWTDFKTALDLAFSAREAVVHAREAEFLAHAAERMRVISLLEGLGADTPPVQLRRTLADTQAQWMRLGPAPRSEAAALEARYRRAHDTAHRWLATSAERSWHAICDALEAKLSLCEELAGGTVSDAQQTELARRWSALPVLPEPLEQALAIRAGLPGTKAQGGVGPLTASTDELLLQLEAAWGLESPPAFEPARRLLKLQAMKAALESRRPTALPPTPEQCLTEVLRRTELEALQRERLGKALFALRRRGSLSAG